MVGMRTCHLQLKMKSKTMSFVDVWIICEDKTFATSVYFNGVYTHFESFLPSTSKFSTVYLLT